MYQQGRGEPERLHMSPDPERTAYTSLGEFISLSLTIFLRELLWVSGGLQCRPLRCHCPSSSKSHWQQTSHV